MLAKHELNMKNKIAEKNAETEYGENFNFKKHKNRKKKLKRVTK